MLTAVVVALGLTALVVHSGVANVPSLSGQPVTVSPSSTPTASQTGGKCTTSSSLSPVAASGKGAPKGNLVGWEQQYAWSHFVAPLDSAAWFSYSGDPAGDTAGWYSPGHVTQS